MRNIGRKKYFLSISLTIFLLLSFLFFAEIFCRLYFQEEGLFKPPFISKMKGYDENPYVLPVRPFARIYIPNSTFIQVLPNYEVAYKINSHGYRGDEIKKKPPGINRLLLLGDSMVNGHGAELKDCWASLIDKALRSDRWEAINCGMQGGSFIDHPTNLDRYFNLKPDSVLISVYYNDLLGDRKIERAFNTLHYMENPYVLMPEKRMLNFIFRSRFIALLHKIWKTKLSTFSSNNVERMIQNNLKNYKKYAEYKQKGEMLMPGDPSLFDLEWDISSLYLGYAVKEFRKRKIKVCIVHIAYVPLYYMQDAPDALTWSYAKMLDEKISGWASANNVPFFSFVPVMESYYKDHPYEDISIKDDGHLTKNGNRLVADELIPFIRKVLE